MIEILKILIAILGISTVSVPDQTATMNEYQGCSDSPYFQGVIKPGGVATTIESKGKNPFSSSSRFMLSGVDFTGDSCNIFIENQTKVGAEFTLPSIVTDSPSLAFLNDGDLCARIVEEEDGTGNMILTIYQKMTVPSLDVRQPTEQQGRLEEFRYDTKKDGKKINKHAMVYLPYGYDPKDKDTKYDVLYLIHGGGDNISSFYNDPRSPLPLVNVLDHLIAEGKMRPIIVICPTFYNDDTNIGQNRMEDAVTATREFNKELRQYLIPAAESNYNTYYKSKDPKDQKDKKDQKANKGQKVKDPITASRDHRAFGGFSMGALTTWFQLAYDADAVGTYIPLSGDLWVYDDEGQRQSAQVASQWLDQMLDKSANGRNFQVMAYTGTKDIAGNPEKILVEALYQLPSKRFTPKNMEFGMKEGGVHYYGDVNEYLYHCLPLLYPAQ